MGAQESHPLTMAPPRPLLPPNADAGGATSGLEPHRDSILEGPDKDNASPLNPELELELSGSPLHSDLVTTALDQNQQPELQADSHEGRKAIEQLDGADNATKNTHSLRLNESGAPDTFEGPYEQQQTWQTTTTSHPQSYGDMNLASGQQQPVAFSDNETSTAFASHPEPELQTYTPVGLTAQQTNQPKAQQRDQSKSMPPPPDEYSVLRSLEPTHRAKPLNEQFKDPYVYCRLISVTVTLFRQGRIREAEALGEFTIDLIGEKAWRKELPTFTSADPLPDANECIITLLTKAAEAIKYHDYFNFAFLSGMIHMLK